MGPPKSPSDIVHAQPNGLDHLLSLIKLLALPALSFLTVQVPRTVDKRSESSNLGPKAIGSWTEDLVPWTVVLATRPSLINRKHVIL